MLTPSHLSSATPSLHPDIHRETAFEQASAPGLSLSERFHKLTASVLTPNLLPNSQEAAANLTNAQRKMLALDRFKNTSQYQSFMNVINHTLAELDSIANSARPQAQKNTNFQSLAAGLWEPVNPNSTSRFGVFQADLYQQACPDANRLVRMPLPSSARTWWPMAGRTMRGHASKSCLKDSMCAARGLSSISRRLHTAFARPLSPRQCPSGSKH